MKLCIVGIGGAGGKITSEFLINDDLNIGFISRITEAEYISPGMIKGIWLEADKNDAKNLQSAFGDLNDGAYPAFFIPHDAIEDSSDVHVRVREKYGYDVKKQGFVRDAQYLKAIFEIFDTDPEIQRIAENTIKVNTAPVSVAEIEANSDQNNNSFKQIPNPIFDSAWNAIRPYTTLGGGECDGILFIVSFGGGTGTGFINPIINHIRNEGKADYPVFVLGILTELGDFADKAQFSKEGRRNLAAISAIYDLLTKSSGANGIIIIDNQMLVERFGSDFTSANKFIYKIMRPMVAARDYPLEVPPSQAIAQHFSGGLSKPPLFVPLYSSQPRRPDPEDKLVEMALADGKLFGCVPEKADWAVVFCRGFVDDVKIRQALSQRTGLAPNNIWVLRKIGDGNDEILILLRNPYGYSPDAHKTEGTLENRLCKVISLALQYINENVQDLFYGGEEAIKAVKDGKDETVKLTPLATQALSQFFFGEEGFIKDNFGNIEGFAFELRQARKRLRSGERPFFLSPLRIFERETKKYAEEENKAESVSIDEQKILELVNKLVDQRLAEIGANK